MTIHASAARWLLESMSAKPQASVLSASDKNRMFRGRSVEHFDSRRTWNRRRAVTALALAPWLHGGLAAGGPVTAPIVPDGDGGFLFRAERTDSTVFLYGTIHVGADSFYPLSPRILRPLRQAQALLVEVDLLSPNLPQLFRQHGMLPESANPLSIAAADAARIDPLLRAAQIDPTFARRFKPDVLAMTLSALSASGLGFSTNYSVDSFLLGFARTAGIRVVELEGLAKQLTMNDSLPSSQRQAMLDDALTGLASGRSARSVARIVRAWQTHNLDLLDLNNDDDSPKELHQAFVEQMAARNATMSERIATLGAEYPHLFAAVGVMHLSGPEGIPRILGHQGYRVVRLM